MYIKKLILFVLIFATFGCNKKSETEKVKTVKVLNSFGIAKIGMTIQEFNKAAGKKLFDENQPNLKIEVDCLKINKNITLRKALVEFQENKLVYVGTEFQKDFFEYLKTNYGIERKEKIGKIQYVNFKTNTEGAYCGEEIWEGHNAIGLYRSGWAPY